MHDCEGAWHIPSAGDSLRRGNDAHEDTKTRRGNWVRELVEIVRTRRGEGCGQGADAQGADMGDAFVLLNEAINLKEGFRRDEETRLFVKRRRDDDIRNARFIFQTQEDKALRGARTLTANHHSSGLEGCFVRSSANLARIPSFRQVLAQKLHRMPTNCHSGRGVIARHTLWWRHRAEGTPRFRDRQIG